MIALVLVVLSAIGIENHPALADDGNRGNKPAKEMKKPANFDGESLATCEHLVDTEKKTIKVKRKFSDANGQLKDKIENVELVDEVSLNPAVCNNTAVSGDFVAMAAASSTPLWTCYGKQELNTLLGNNWKLQGWQSYRTSSYYGNILWPPFTPIIDADGNLGWSTKSTKVTGPEKWQLINGAVYKGATTFQATFEYKIAGFLPTIDTDSPAFRLVFGHQYCRKTTLSSS
jgi:hypothetical protein